MPKIIPQLKRPSFLLKGSAKAVSYLLLLKSTMLNVKKGGVFETCAQLMTNSFPE